MWAGIPFEIRDERRFRHISAHIRDGIMGALRRTRRSEALISSVCPGLARGVQRGSHVAGAGFDATFEVIAVRSGFSLLILAEPNTNTRP
ncbi:hypothetical protein CC2G_011361 [Coprinopsis cinerea AmutBmut pab1-1]|nr:hypothetical protein CC2G_011361 [Coprinopsis cinerea AmutBmut pab1-1]